MTTFCFSDDQDMVQIVCFDCLVMLEMSIGLDLDWTGTGLWLILLDLKWIRTMHCFINLGSGPDLDLVNGK